MMYFKTKKNRLLIYDVSIHVYLLIAQAGEMSIYSYKVSYGRYERVWKQFEKITPPNILEDNSDDLEMYYAALDEKNEIEQEMADQDWLYAKGCEFYGTNKKL
jgi:hypothetical protein